MSSSVIRARVLDTEGHPVAGARVFFVRGPSSFPDVAALTDASGLVLLAAPSPGIYEVQAVADGFQPQTIAITVGEETEVPQDITLKPA